jgi:hypothetical protein
MRRDGVAALFDSLLFLAVVATVSVVLLVAASPRDGPPSAEVSAELDAAHEALLRCTVPVAPGRSLPLLEAVVQGGEVPAAAEGTVVKVLGELLPAKAWRWTASTPSAVTAIGPHPPQGVDIHASVVRVPAPGGEIVLTLQAWAR